MNPTKNQQRTRLYFAVLLVSILWIGSAFTFTATPAKPNTDETKIVILHVNDMHAAIDRFSKIAKYVETEKQQNENVFFFDAGDNFTGNPVVDQYKPKGDPVRQLLYKMKVDVLELGNHEFDFGQELLKGFITGAPFPVISANIEVKSGIIPQPKPFTILKTKNGIKIAVLGLIQVEKQNGMPSSHPDNLKGLTFPDPLETAKKYKYLRKDNEVFIALTHLGTEDDEPLAKLMPELDVIVGGHSHTTIDKQMEVNGVLITQAASSGKYVGRIELVVKNGKVIQKTSKLIDVKNLTESNPELDEMIKKFNDNPELDKIVVKYPRSYRGKLELGNYTTDAIRKLFNLDAAFHNSGGLRIDALPEDVKLRDIYSLHPFSNSIVKFEMTPEEIRSLIRFDYEKNKGLDLKVSGLVYIVTADKDGKVKSIDLRDRRGNPLDENKTYTVGINDYISASYKFNHKDPGKSLMLTAAEVLLQAIEKKLDITKRIECARTLDIIDADEQ